ncbi:hypothetical protein [Variovorax paradoxus]|uniref:hypothetical protein n=1 Tax=Variovorax paradoxus TaxID=34073 RepID=UPI001F5E363A|nr:hypothetical protein [Variovorax paradoxus]
MQLLVGGFCNASGGGHGRERAQMPQVDAKRAGMHPFDNFLSLILGIGSAHVPP